MNRTQRRADCCRLLASAATPPPPLQRSWRSRSPCRWLGVSASGTTDADAPVRATNVFDNDGLFYLSVLAFARQQVTRSRRPPYRITWSGVASSVSGIGTSVTSTPICSRYRRCLTRMQRRSLSIRQAPRTAPPIEKPEQIATIFIVKRNHCTKHSRSRSLFSALFSGGPTLPFEVEP